jgi:hypothetical protein
MHSLLLAQTHAEPPQPLEAADILVFLAIVAAAVFFVVLAGLGYFTPGKGDDA